eukprot:EG_transcript_18580
MNATSHGKARSHPADYDSFSRIFHREAPYRRACPHAALTMPGQVARGRLRPPSPAPSAALARTYPIQRSSSTQRAATEGRPYSSQAHSLPLGSTMSTTSLTAASSALRSTLGSTRRSDLSSTTADWKSDQFAETIGYHNTPSSKYREPDIVPTATLSLLTEDAGTTKSSLTRASKSSRRYEVGERHARFAPEEGLLQVYD